MKQAVTDFQVMSVEELWSNTRKEREEEKAPELGQREIFPSVDAAGTILVQFQETKETCII